MFDDHADAVQSMDPLVKAAKVPRKSRAPASTTSAASTASTGSTGKKPNGNGQQSKEFMMGVAHEAARAAVQH